MTKKEFLDTLADSLAGNVPAAEIEENIRYYRDYIEDSGQPEDKVLEALGDPHLIAKTIIDSFKASKGPMADFYTEQARDEYSRGIFEEDGSSAGGEQYSNNGIWHIKWYHKLGAVLAVAGVVMLLLVIGGIAAVIIVRVVLPVLLLVIVLKFIRDYFHRG